MIDSVSEFEKEIDDNVFGEKQSKTETDFDFKITFKDFLAIYFSAYNPGGIVTKTFMNTVVENE
jgi:hypothetical protein